MTKAEVARLLAMIAAFDRRTIGEADVEAWHLILADLDTNDCANAVRDHYTTQRDWIMPADVRTAAVAAQRKRIGQQKVAALRSEIERQNAGELHDRPVAALTVGQPISQVLARTVHEAKLRDVQASTQATGDSNAQREQARLEIERLHQAQPEMATADGGTDANA